jgi:ankyrin repeat protein
MMAEDEQAQNEEEEDEEDQDEEDQDDEEGFWDEDEDEDEDDEEEEALPILRPVIRGDVNEVARLLDAEPHLLEARDVNRANATLLVVAAQEGHVGVVRLLLGRGAEVNAAGKFGETALHHAVGGGHEEMVNVLLSSGADSGMKSYDGDTALMWASCSGSLGMTKQLLQHMQGRGLNERDNHGRTAVGWACQFGSLEVLRLLLLAGADHTIGNNYEETPRQEAEEQGHTECVALLEVSGPRVEAGLLRV